MLQQPATPTLQRPLALTVVLICEGQASYLPRALAHYSPLAEQVLVVDIAQPLAGNVCPTGAANVSYLNSTLATLGVDLSRHLLSGSTPFAVIASPMEFLLPQGLEQSVQALAEQPGLSLCQGFSLGYQARGQQVAYFKRSSSRALAEPDSALERMRQQVALELQAWRAVCRREALCQALTGCAGDSSLLAWKVALSYRLLAQGEARVLPVTYSVVEQAAAAAAGEVIIAESTAGVIAQLQALDAGSYQLFTSHAGQEVLKRFVASAVEPGQGARTPLLFTSAWGSISSAPERSFEPRQFIELPYYTPVVFAQLSALEFLLHCFPAGDDQHHSLEGTWVQQQNLLRVHPNDTPDSLKARTWKAFAAGFFNLEVCQKLLALLASPQEEAEAQELASWVQRLTAVNIGAVAHLLAQTGSGRVLQAIAQRSPSSRQAQQALQLLAAQGSPRVGFVIVDLEEGIDGLQGTFDSLLASGLTSFKAVVLKVGKLPAITTPNDTVHFVKVTEENWVARLNQAVAQLDTEWVMTVAAGDVFTPAGLLRLHVELLGAAGCRAVLADEVQRDEDGRLRGVQRPGPNLEMLRSQPQLMAGHWVIRREATLAIGGYSESATGALDFDLILRLIEDAGMSGFAHMDEYLVISGHREPDPKAELATLNRHLTALGYKGNVSAMQWPAFQVDYRHVGAPAVTILLDSGSSVDSLEQCLASISQRTRYQRYRIVVIDNASDCAAMRACLAGLPATNSRIDVLRSEMRQPGAELINWASQAIDSEYLVLLSADCRIVTPAWLEQMLNQARRPEVGAVGVKVHDSNDLIVHAGYELLSDQTIVSPLAGLSRHAWGPSARLMVERACTAVSGVCLMVRKASFDHVQGMSVVADDLEIAAVDLCLKLNQAGALVVWAAQAQVSYVGSALAGLGGDALAERWPGAFASQVTLEPAGPRDLRGAALEWL